MTRHWRHVKIQAALNRLHSVGKPQEIQAHLEAKEIWRGTNPDLFYSQQCPIAMYLKHETGEDTFVTRRDVQQENGGDHFVVAMMPPNVRAYVDWHDRKIDRANQPKGTGL